MSAAPQLALAAHAVTLAGPTDFAGWREAARRLALESVGTEEIAWFVEESADGSPPPLAPPREGEGDSCGSSPSPLRGGVRGGGIETTAAEQAPETTGRSRLHVPREFVDRAEVVICHSDPERFGFLYRLLLRFQHEPSLLKIASDPDVRRFEEMGKAVRRDMHKMRAFVRFRRIGADDGDRYVAWFEPSHFIVERNAPFFARRFTGMHWSILTPYRSAHWDGEQATFGPGGSRADAPADDGAEELWRTYYRNIFNPARLKPRAMQAEMPKKYWRNLPEASLIPDLIAGADGATKEMVARMPTVPAPHHATVQAKHWAVREVQAPDPDELAGGIAELRVQAKGCRRCPLWHDATQMVFGEGPENADVIFVGEQPGDQEDLAGKPFVGPAGKVFDAVLDGAGIDRAKTYVTNAVKHFKFEPRGKRRIHSKPNAGEVQACRWWLDHELKLLRPRIAVAVGATAALALLDKAIPVTRMRGQVIEREDRLKVFITIHPSFILRIPEPLERQAERARFLADMQAVKRLMAP